MGAAMSSSFWVIAACFIAFASAETVLVTGATGRTGSLAYAQLKAAGFDVRGFVMNRTYAQSVLHCGACSEADGIYVGDITQPETLVAPMVNVTRLVITTGVNPTCILGGLDCHYNKGAFPVDIDWHGNRNQILAALHAGVKHVLLVSSMETSIPDTFLDKMGHGWTLFYKLNAEAFLMNSGMAYTIIKPGGLTTNAGGNELYVGHEDQGFNGTSSHEISRTDVATVITEACKNPSLASNSRFDLVADPKKPRTSDDFATFFAAAKQII